MVVCDVWAKCCECVAKTCFYTLYLVVCGSASSKVIIVHRGQVIVNETHGVDNLHGASSGHGGLDVTTHQLAGCEGERGAHALAASEQ